MTSFVYRIKDPNGLHARPAGLLVREAMKYSSDIGIEKGAVKADLKKLFSVMGMGVKCGDEVKITIDGADEEKAEKELFEYIKEHM